MTGRFITPFRVGLLVLAGIASFFVLLSYIARPGYGEGDSYRVLATFRDASGIGPQSRVLIAGIEVGIVESVSLTRDARALVSLRIRDDVPLFADARLAKRSSSLLGDFVLDLHPGTPELPELGDGGRIENVAVQGGVEDVFATLGDVTRDIQDVTRSLKELLASEQGVGSIKEIIASMNDVAQGLNQTVQMAGGRLDSILGDVEALSHDLRTLAAGQQDDVAHIVANIRLFSEQANRVLASIEAIVGSNQGDLRASVSGLHDTLGELKKTLQGAQSMVATVERTVEDTRAVVARVERGEGTLGKLLVDDSIAVKLDRTLTDMNRLAVPFDGLQANVNVREEVHWAPWIEGTHPKGKASVRVTLVPGADSLNFYGLELVGEPRGKTSSQIVRRSAPDGSSSVETISTTTEELKFSAFFGRRFGPAAVRVGLMESTGGVGGDLWLAGNQLQLSLDAFDWSNPEHGFPRLRASGQWIFLDHFYLGVGFDDVLNRTVVGNGRLLSGPDAFVSAGLTFSDETLKALLTAVGSPARP